jgi:hypothetical protein
VVEDEIAMSDDSFGTWFFVETDFWRRVESTYLYVGYYCAKLAVLIIFTTSVVAFYTAHLINSFEMLVSKMIQVIGVSWLLSKIQWDSDCNCLLDSLTIYQ